MPRRLCAAAAERPEGPPEEPPHHRPLTAGMLRRPCPAVRAIALSPPSDGRIWVERYYWDCHRRKTYYYISLPPPTPPPPPPPQAVSTIATTPDDVGGQPVGQLFEPPSGAAYVVRRPERVLSDLERGSTDSSFPFVFAGPDRLEELRFLVRYRFTRQELCELPLPSHTLTVRAKAPWKRWSRCRSTTTLPSQSSDDDNDDLAGSVTRPPLSPQMRNALCQAEHRSNLTEA